MKRYLLFGGYTYYPSGGWDDLKGSFDSALEAANAAREDDDNMIEEKGLDWWHVVDSLTMTVVLRGNGQQVASNVVGRQH